MFDYNDFNAAHQIWLDSVQSPSPVNLIPGLALKTKIRTYFFKASPNLSYQVTTSKLPQEMLLKSKTLPYQEEQYWDLIAKKEKADQAAKSNASMIDHDI